MTRAASLTGSLLIMMLMVSSCGRLSCAYLTDPVDPFFPMLVEPGERYATEEGHFTLTLDSDVPWPPEPGTTSLVLHIEAQDGERLPTALTTDLPVRVDDAHMASDAPMAVALSDDGWRLDGVQLPEPGVWELGLTMQAGNVEDDIVLYLQVKPSS